MLHHSNRPIQRFRQFLGRPESGEPRVKDVVPSVGNKGLSVVPQAQAEFAADRAQPSCRRLPAEHRHELGGSRVAALDLSNAIAIDRPYVLGALGKEGYDNPRCGFIAFAADVVEPYERPYIEVRTSNLAVGYRDCPPRNAPVLPR